MGGFISVSTTIHGTVGSPGIPFVDSPTGGFFETNSGGVGISLAAQGFFELDQAGFELGYKPPAAFTLSLVSGSPFVGSGADSRGAAISADGRFIVQVNTTANTISVYERNLTTNALSQVVGSSFSGIGTTPNDVVFTPNNNFIIVTCLNNPSTINVVPFNRATGVLGSAQGFDSDTSYNQIAMHPTLPHIYVGYGAAVRVYDYSQTTGVIAVPNSQLTAIAFTPTKLLVSPDGKYLFATANNSNQIYVFSIGALGLLTAVSGSPYTMPGLGTDVAVSSDNKYVYVTHQAANAVSVYSINSSTGILSAIVGSPFTVAAPVAIGFVDASNNIVFSTQTPSVRAYARDVVTGGIGAQIAGSPFAGILSRRVLIPSDNGAVFVTGSSGQVEAYNPAAVSFYNMIDAIFDPSAGLNGVYNVNGILQVLGSPVLSQIGNDARYAPLNKPVPYVDAGGTADIITATFLPAIAALTDGLMILVDATAANATTTPTLNVNGLGAKTIQKGENLPLLPGDISGTNHTMLLVYKLPTTTWALLNPALISGVVNGSDAPTGGLGEYVTSQIVSPGSALTSNVVLNVTSMSIPAGDWDVWGTIDFLPNAATSITQLTSGISGTSGAIGSQDTMQQLSWAAQIPGANNLTLNTPHIRISTVGAVTIYLVARGIFTLNTLNAFGTMYRRRVR